MNFTNFGRSIVILMAVAAAATMVSAQGGVQTRSITSDDFAAKRPVGTTTAGNGPRRTYNRAKVVPNPHIGKRSRPKPPKDAKLTVTEIGITMWKLRPPKQGEAGYLLPVLDDKKLKQMWLAERVDIDSIFKAGDKIRFAVESSETAYLYVLDRETYSDGSFGEPYLIFPESARDNNSVGPGSLVDIPDQRDDTPYFNMTPKGSKYQGELLTVIISPKPLSNLKTNSDGKILNPDELTNLEFSGDAELFSRVDTADKIFSQVESESACGGRSRQSSDGQTGRPCGVKTRQLTREEALPQSIYRVKGLSGQPAIAFIKLAVR